MKDIKNIVATDEADALAEGLSLSEYLAKPHMSGSSLLEGRKSVKHIRSHYETETPVTDPMRKGSAADSLLFDYLVPAMRDGKNMREAVDLFDESWPVFEGKQRRGKDWDAFSEEHGDDYLNSFGERQDILLMIEAVANDKTARTYWREGVSQSTLLMNESGLLLKGRPDWLCHAIVDLKTTARISQWDLSKTVFSLGYHWKMAMYRRWMKRITGNELPCVLIFVESSPPYDVVVMPIDIATLGLAEESAEQQIAELRQAIETDVWPGVAKDEEVDLEVPPWEMPGDINA